MRLRAPSAIYEARRNCFGVAEKRLRTPAMLIASAQGPQVGLDHAVDQLLEGQGRRPAETFPGPARITDQRHGLPEPDQLRVDADVRLGLEADAGESGLGELRHGVPHAAGQDVVVWAVVLEHEPRSADDVP